MEAECLELLMPLIVNSNLLTMIINKWMILLFFPSTAMYRWAASSEHRNQQPQFKYPLSVGGFRVNSVSFDIKVKHNTVRGRNHGKRFLKQGPEIVLIDETLYYMQTTPTFYNTNNPPHNLPHIPFLKRFRTLVHCNKHISLFS